MDLDVTGNQRPRVNFRGKISGLGDPPRGDFRAWLLGRLVGLVFSSCFQSLDLEARRRSSPALVLGARQLPHLRVLGKLL